MNIKKLTEIAKEKGKTLLIESYSIPIAPENIVIYDKGILVESEGKKVECRAVFKNVPVSRYSENLNKRVYSKKLWEKVHKDKVFESSLAFADHAEGEGSVKDITGVWGDFKVNENTANADLYCVGEYGQLMAEVAKASGKIGFSTVGFGQQEERVNELGEYAESSNLFVVQWDTYEYSHTDWIVNPSQQTYATSNHMESKNIVKKDIILNEAITNKHEETNTKGEDKEVVMKYTYEQLNSRNQIKGKLREAKRNDNYKEAMEELADLEIAPDFTDLQEKVNTLVDDLQSKLEDQVVVAEKTITDIQGELKEITEKYEKAKKIIEKIGLTEDTDEGELKETVTDLKEKLESAEKNQKEMLKDLGVVDKLFENAVAKDMQIKQPQDFAHLMEDTVARDHDIKCLVEDRTKMGDDVKRYKENEVDMLKAIKEREDELDKLEYKFEAAEKEDEKKDDKEDKEKDEDKKEDDKEEKKEQDEKKDDEKEDEKEDKKDDEEKDEKEEKKESVEPYQFEYAVKGEKKEELKEEEVEEVKVEKKSSDVDKLIEREIKRNPSVKDIAKELKECTSLEQVIQKVELFEDNSKEDVVKIEEADVVKATITHVPRPGFMGTGRI